MPILQLVSSVIFWVWTSGQQKQLLIYWYVNHGVSVDLTARIMLATTWMAHWRTTNLRRRNFQAVQYFAFQNLVRKWLHDAPRWSYRNGTQAAQRNPDWEGAPTGPETSWWRGKANVRCRHVGCMCCWDGCRPSIRGRLRGPERRQMLRTMEISLTVILLQESGTSTYWSNHQTMHCQRDSRSFTSTPKSENVVVHVWSVHRSAFGFDSRWRRIEYPESHKQVSSMTNWTRASRSNAYRTGQTSY